MHFIWIGQFQPVVEWEKITMGSFVHFGFDRRCRLVGFERTSRVYRQVGWNLLFPPACYLGLCSTKYWKPQYLTFAAVLVFTQPYVSVDLHTCKIRGLSLGVSCLGATPRHCAQAALWKVLYEHMFYFRLLLASLEIVGDDLWGGCVWRSIFTDDCKTTAKPKSSVDVSLHRKHFVDSSLPESMFKFSFQLFKASLSKTNSIAVFHAHKSFRGGNSELKNRVVSNCQLQKA